MSLTDRIPEKGLILAEGRKELVFAAYIRKEGKILIDGLDRTDLLASEKCHLFDRDTEYRSIRRGSRGDLIETVLTRAEEEETDPDLIFPEEVLVKTRYAGKGGVPGRIKIINRYEYSKNDTLVLRDYRIAMV